MNRQEFTAARRLQRTFTSFVREVIKADEAGDFTGYRHLVRWHAAEFVPHKQAAEQVAGTQRPGIGLTTQLGMIRALPDQRADRISHVRMSRYFRKPAPLPR